MPCLTPGYRQALRSAALDGVDVRLLVPHGSDIEWIANVSRTMYRSLLEAGVRVFEWNGPMVHAKTAVVDGRWTRIGSTNLNVSSWLGNWELDVGIEDEGIAHEMAAIFLDDLTNATEIVITPRNTVRPHEPGPRAPSELGSSSRALTDATRMGSILGAAVKGHRNYRRPLRRNGCTAALEGCATAPGPLAGGKGRIGLKRSGCRRPTS